MDWFSLVLFIIITQVVCIMVGVYRYCLLTSKQCPCGVVYPRDISPQVMYLKFAEKFSLKWRA